VPAPIAIPSIEPPLKDTLLASCVAIVPRPKFVLASAAFVAPVPPCAI
jgi:hypothetical protein